MTVDFDVAVVGAGIAGVTAALRVRRPEVVGALPCSVALFEGNRPGGLLNWKNYRIIGPHYRFRRQDWAALMKDVQKLEIPIVQESVLSVDLSGPVKRLHTASRTYTAYTVIATVGNAPLHNAADFGTKDGVLTAFGSLDDVRDTIRGQMRRSGNETLLLFGPPPICEFARYLADLKPIVLVEPPYDGAVLPDHVLRGTVVDLTGNPKVTGVRYRDLRGQLQRVDCDCVFRDFNSYMSVTNTTSFLSGSGLAIVRGFLQTDRAMATSIEGVFAAGDVTGGMFSVSKALHEGNVAGFSALRFLHRKRYAAEPNLHPFYWGDYGTDVSHFHRRHDVRMEVSVADGLPAVEVHGFGPPVRFPARQEQVPLLRWASSELTKNSTLEEAYLAAGNLSETEVFQTLELLVRMGVLSFGLGEAQSGHWPAIPTTPW